MDCRHMGAVGSHFAARVLPFTHELFDGRLRVIAVAGASEAHFEDGDGDGYDPHEQVARASTAFLVHHPRNCGSSERTWPGFGRARRVKVPHRISQRCANWLDAGDSRRKRSRRSCTSGA